MTSKTATIQITDHERFCVLQACTYRCSTEQEIRHQNRVVREFGLTEIEDAQRDHAEEVQVWEEKRQEVERAMAAWQRRKQAGEDAGTVPTFDAPPPKQADWRSDKSTSVTVSERAARHLRRSLAKLTETFPAGRSQGDRNNPQGVAIPAGLPPFFARGLGSVLVKLEEAGLLPELDEDEPVEPAAKP